MKKNVGTLDKVIRIVLALVGGVLILSGVVHGALAIIVGIVAGVLLITASISFCGVYTLLGISTKK